MKNAKTDREVRDQLGDAVGYLLQRTVEDPDLGYHLGPVVQAFEDLVVAYAAHLGKPVEQVRKRFTVKHERETCVAILQRRIRELEARIDLEDA